MRLRRTIAAAIVLLLFGFVTFQLVRRAGDAADLLRSVSRPSATPMATAEPSAVPATSIPDNEDGSSASETAASSRVSVPEKGDGKLHAVAVPGVANDVPGRVVRYTVEVEGGLGVDEGQVAATVQSILLDPKGWQKADHVRFVNVPPQQVEAGASVDIRVTLASPSLTDRLCAPLRTLSQVSCWNGGRSVLNLRRWTLGDDSYGSDVARYRVYQVNHEVGHGLGHQHRDCPGPGVRAPIMAQQTLDLGGCRPWPYPTGA